MTEVKKEKCCGGVIVEGDKILMVQQGNGVYAFPKGHVEGNEIEIETAMREILEETGVETELDSGRRVELFYHIDDLNVDKTVVLFVGRPVGGIEVKPQEGEIVSVEWVDKDKVGERLQFPEWKKAWKEIKELL